MCFCCQTFSLEVCHTSRHDYLLELCLLSTRDFWTLPPPPGHYSENPYLITLFFWIVPLGLYSEISRMLLCKYWIISIAFGVNIALDIYVEPFLIILYCILVWLPTFCACHICVVWSYFESLQNHFVCHISDSFAVPVLHYGLGKTATIHQLTTILSTLKNVLFPGHNHLLTTGADNPTLSDYWVISTGGWQLVMTWK